MIPISNPLIPVTPLESLANRDQKKPLVSYMTLVAFFGQKISKQIDDAITRLFEDPQI